MGKEAEQGPNTAEALALGWALKRIGYVTQLMQAGTNILIAEQLRHIPQEYWILVLGGLAVITHAVGWTVETKTLLKRNWEIGEAATLTFRKLNKLPNIVRVPLALAANTLQGYLWDSWQNPVNVYAAIDFVKPGNNEYAMADLCSIQLLSLIYTGINGLVLAGKTEGLVKAVKWGEKIVKVNALKAKQLAFAKMSKYASSGRSPD